MNNIAVPANDFCESLRRIALVPGLAPKSQLLAIASAVGSAHSTGGYRNRKGLPFGSNETGFAVVGAQTRSYPTITLEIRYPNAASIALAQHA